MKERPILFSAPMVRALLDGTKTQTRRAVKPQFAADAEPAEMGATNERGHQISGHSGVWWCDAEGNPEKSVRCPYGQPGDRLWVREAWRASKVADELRPSQLVGGSCSLVWYEAQDEVPFHPSSFGKLRPSIHMPRWASRILLEVTAVRVERLQDISAADARAEGCPDKPVENAERASIDLLAKLWYHDLWERINGADSWAANPWVWVVEFKRVQP